jgi:predicted transcriptional regulator
MYVQGGFMAGSKIVGIIFMAIGIVIGLLVTTLIVISVVTGDIQTAGGSIIGIGACGVVPMLVLGGIGLFFFMRGRAEEAEMIEVRQRERLLGMIQAQGQVSLNNMMVEMKMNRDQIKQAIYDLVHLGLFAGYIDWSKQTFYSQDMAQVGDNKCPNCGGVRELVGQGVVKCPYCGVELFIPPGAAQTGAAATPSMFGGGV